MLLATALSLAPASLLASAGPRVDPEGSRHVHYYLGVRSLDEDDWEGLDEPIALEMSLEWRKPDAWLGFEVGASYAFDDGTVRGDEVDLRSLELYGGLRLTAQLFDGHLRPYVGGGVSAVRMDRYGNPNDGDSGIGGYARAGVAWAFDCGMEVGVDYRAAFIDHIDIFQSEVDADFDQLSLTVGFSF